MKNYTAFKGVDVSEKLQGLDATVEFTFSPQEGYSLLAGTFKSKSSYIVSYISTKLDNYVNPTRVVAILTDTLLSLSFFICPALSCFSPAVADNFNYSSSLKEISIFAQPVQSWLFVSTFLCKLPMVTLFTIAEKQLAGPFIPSSLFSCQYLSQVCNYSHCT